MAPVKIDRKLSFMCLLNEKRQCHGFSWVPIFSPKSSNAKYKTLGTSQANSGGKNPGIILREVRYWFKTYHAYYIIKGHIVSSLVT